MNFKESKKVLDELLHEPIKRIIKTEFYDTGDNFLILVTELETKANEVLTVNFFNQETTGTPLRDALECHDATQYLYDSKRVALFQLLTNSRNPYYEYETIEVIEE